MNEVQKSQYKAGFARSIVRLEALGFDPIKVLVDKHLELEGELEYHRRIREGKVVPLKASGRPIDYNPEVHMSVYDKQINIAKELLRYRYGRVPETGMEEKSNAPLIINLSRRGDDGNFELPNES